MLQTILFALDTGSGVTSGTSLAGEVSSALSTTSEPTATAPSWLQSGGTILMLVLAVLVFYFFILRPEKKRKKEINALRDSLAAGDTVTTIGGIVGTVISVKDDTFTLESGPSKTKLVFQRFALRSIDKTAEEEDDD